LRVEIFFVTTDKQLQELNCRFNDQTNWVIINDQAMELLILKQWDSHKGFNIDKICIYVDTYYPMDFNEQKTLQKIM